MHLGMVGLGRMGAGMSARLVEGGHQVVGYDVVEEARREATEAGVVTVGSIAEMVDALEVPRAVWVMVPAGVPTESVLAELAPLLEAGDTIIDGGNSFYQDTLARRHGLADRGIDLVDAGTSGGVWGREEGFSLMVGGPVDTVERLRPLLATLAPTPETGWDRVGPTGAGHFVKMVHNGIEYGMMQAMAEGFAILQAKEEFELDLHRVAEVWRYGSVIRSWLLDLASEIFSENPNLDSIAPFVQDSGEGRWTVREAIDLNVSTPVLALSLIERISSRDQVEYGDRLLAALRHKFGGHAVKPGGGNVTIVPD